DRLRRNLHFRDAAGWQAGTVGAAQNFLLGNLDTEPFGKQKAAGEDQGRPCGIVAPAQRKGQDPLLASSRSPLGRFLRLDIHCPVIGRCGAAKTGLPVVCRREACATALLPYLAGRAISGLGRMSSTVSGGRQSLVPFGVSTIGRLIRIGCSIMKPISSSVHFGSSRPSSS